ncbi:OmpA family protein [Thiomicrorhabdus sp.]|uniref:OmpA family protein n=1 Tax=Thiomicrorhabdus sp. TaxID=2039724 RepID=UPI0029C72B59|nr:OmpA family protein [Thiomicrorhabdus sp.]
MKTRFLPLIAALGFATMAPAHAEDISGKGTEAYVIDSNGNVVRDSYDRCVRSIKWSKETAINKCEGWPEPAPKAEPKPEPKPLPEIAPAPAKAPVITPAPEKAMPAPPEFRGFFDFDSAVLKSSAHQELDVFADYMNATPESKVQITGHTDSTGPAAYNQKLSERRADAVKEYLGSKGIADDRMNATGMGETAPIASNATRAGRAENRRVEVEIVK